MKKYEAPELITETFDVEDVITYSTIQPPKAMEQDANPLPENPILL